MALLFILFPFVYDRKINIHCHKERCACRLIRLSFSSVERIKNLLESVKQAGFFFLVQYHCGIKDIALLSTLSLLPSQLVWFLVSLGNHLFYSWVSVILVKVDFVPHSL